MVSHPQRSDELARARDLAWAEALAGLSRVAATLSTRLHEAHRSDAAAGAGGAALPPAPVRSGRIPHGGFGARQRAVLGLSGLDTVHGLSAGDVARALNLVQPNSHSALTGLEKLGHLERVPGERPAHWRRVRT